MQGMATTTPSHQYTFTEKKRIRKSFAKRASVLKVPFLLETQLASYRLLAVDEYERFGKAYDLRVLAALAGKARLSMLHAHGDDIMFDLLADYPVEMINWHDRLTEPTLRDAASRFPGLLVGGLNEHGALAKGDLHAIEAEVRDAIAQTGGRRLMIGPGCVVPVAATP